MGRLHLSLCPGCALPCLENGNSTSCALDDTSCLCHDQNFVNATTECFEENCSGTDLQQSIAAAVAMCRAVVSQHPSYSLFLSFIVLIQLDSGCHLELYTGLHPNLYLLDHGINFPIVQRQQFGCFKQRQHSACLDRTGPHRLRFVEVTVKPSSPWSAMSTVLPLSSVAFNLTERSILSFIFQLNLFGLAVCSTCSFRPFPSPFFFPVFFVCNYSRKYHWASEPSILLGHDDGCSLFPVLFGTLTWPVWRSIARFSTVQRFEAKMADGQVTCVIAPLWA